MRVGLNHNFVSGAPIIIDEPPLVWPELPDDLKTDRPPEKKTGVKEQDYGEGDGKEG